MVNVKDIVTLPNGNKGLVWRVHEYGYVAQDMTTNNMETVFIFKSPQPAKEKYRYEELSNADEVCQWLNEHPEYSPNDFIIVSTLCDYKVFYKTETAKSINDRLGKQISSIFD